MSFPKVFLLYSLSKAVLNYLYSPPSGLIFPKKYPLKIYALIHEPFPTSVVLMKE